ncbi:hypothetical protein Q2380_14295 [Enterobacter hormaechei]|uniref:hypothetical protein n=1 Tax=Enterobacter hormaechei TaxID=158836 RepID=UPI002665FA1F|nr:hypothetical protein [Enterobacter hormaechei]MDO2399890.1 hypothetical protein [Enterobacter hormaechei]MDO2403424.1 hypothetical protein [Enterobacter hormaechei]MDO2417439.1 hypothetical protein [Enterobacter hormaechei]MDO2428169.1 hypothetical protein [Enterobacter hormaechei]
MVMTVRTDARKEMCQLRDNAHNAHKARKAPGTSVPASWQLTPQQQAFIDVFAEDEPKKQ